VSVAAESRPETSPSGMERRRFPRFEPQDLAEPVLVIGSRLLNINRGGLMLEAPVPLAAESVLQLRLVLDGARADVEARVRACVPRGQGRHAVWDVGLEFETLDPATIERLDRALVPRRRNAG
jgi:hypothetical protein